MLYLGKAQSRSESRRTGILRFLASSALPGTDYRFRAVQFMADRMVRDSKNKCLSPFY
jgi:hypothetical protein